MMPSGLLALVGRVRLRASSASSKLPLEPPHRPTRCHRRRQVAMENLSYKTYEAVGWLGEVSMQSRRALVWRVLHHEVIASMAHLRTADMFRQLGLVICLQLLLNGLLQDLPLRLPETRGARHMACATERPGTNQDLKQGYTRTVSKSVEIGKETFRV